MRLNLAVVLLFTCVGFARSEEIRTNGKVFLNAEVIRYEADGLIIKHDGGTNRIAWQDLPAAVRQRHRAEARRRKEEEIQKLKRDLARAEAEAARLNQDEGPPERKGNPLTEKSGTATAPRPAVEPPAKIVARLPPLKPDEMVDAAELVQQFQNDPPGADQRYRKKTFRVRGVIERFEPKKFVRKYYVILESPDRFVRVVAVFDYPNDYKTVFTTQKGRTLVGKPAPNQEVTMMRAGQTIVLQGKCQGARDTEIAFTGCEWVQGYPCCQWRKDLLACAHSKRTAGP